MHCLIPLREFAAALQVNLCPKFLFLIPSFASFFFFVGSSFFVVAFAVFRFVRFSLIHGLDICLDVEKMEKRKVWHRKTVILIRCVFELGHSWTYFFSFVYFHQSRLILGTGSPAMNTNLRNSIQMTILEIQFQERENLRSRKMSRLWESLGITSLRLKKKKKLLRSFPEIGFL